MRIKGSGDKNPSTSSRLSSRSCEMTPQVSVKSNIHGIGRYEFLGTMDSEIEQDEELA